MIETTNSAQVIIITLGILTLVGSIYFCFYKIKTIESTTVQTRRHLMYQQQIIEKHNKLLQTLTTAYPRTDEPTVTLDPIERVSFESPPIPVENNRGERPKPQAPQAPLNILPMLSTIMNMMNTNDSFTEEESVNEDNVEEIEKRKSEMTEELESELKELNEQILEPIGQVEEVKKVETPLKSVEIHEEEDKTEGRVDDIN
jgi:hypothetical protein